MSHMKKRMYLLLALLSFASCAPAQEVTQATRQGWAGGVCCVSGVNYTVTVLLKHQEPKTVEVEKIYLQGQHGMEGTVQSTGALPEGTRCTITFGTRRDETRDIRIMPIDPNELRQPDMRQFEGQALLILKVDGKPMEVIVTEFQEMPYLAYP